MLIYQLKPEGVVNNCFSKVKGQRYYLTGPEGMQKTTANNRTYTDGKIHIYTDM